MSLMIIKQSIPEVFWGAISESILSAKLYLKDNEDRFVKSKKCEIGTLLIRLVSMKHKEKKEILESTSWRCLMSFLSIVLLIILVMEILICFMIQSVLALVFFLLMIIYTHWM